MTRKLIKAGWVVSLDSRIGDLEAGDILIEDDKIIDVGHGIDAEDAEIVDAKGMIVMPGLVNAHIHLWQSGFRGMGVEWVGADYFRDMHGNMATHFTAEDYYLGTLAGAVKQLNTGVTTVFEWSHGLRDLEMAERAVDALEESGIRAVFGHGTAKPPNKPGETPHSHIPHPRDRVDALRGGRLGSDDNLVTLALAILGAEYATWDVAVKDHELARELDLLCSAHVWSCFNPAPGEPDAPYPELARMGLMGPKHNLVHANFITDDHLKAVLDTGSSISSTVMVETRGHWEEPLTGRVRDLGHMPSLGNDTAMLVSDDFWTEMKAALICLRHREQHQNRGKPAFTSAAVRSREALEWATIGGAKALCMDHKIGSLTPGKQADLVLLNAGGVNLAPIMDPLFSITDQASAADVDSVMIAGEFKKRDGHLVTDQAVLAQKLEALEASAHRILRVSGISVPSS